MNTYISSDTYRITPYTWLNDDIQDIALTGISEINDPQRERIKDAVEAVYTALNDMDRQYPLDEPVTIGIGETHDPYVQDTMDGATGNAFDYDLIVCYHPDTDNWQDKLEATTVHERSHAAYIEQAKETGQLDDTYRNWHQLLLEAHGMHITDSMTDIDPPWRTAVSLDYLTEHHNDIRDELRKPSSWTTNTSTDIFMGDDTWEQWTGYTLAWHLGDELLDDNEPDGLPSMSYEETIDAVDQLLTES